MCLSKGQLTRRWKKSNISDLIGINGRQECVEDEHEKEGHEEDEEATKEQDEEEGTGRRKRQKIQGR